jgi:hypothetical protein
MPRREFIAGLGGEAVAWPFTAGAQQRPVPVIGYLSGGTESDQRDHLRTAFHRGSSLWDWATATPIHLDNA